MIASSVPAQSRPDAPGSGGKRTWGFFVHGEIIALVFSLPVGRAAESAVSADEIRADVAESKQELDESTIVKIADFLENQVRKEKKEINDSKSA